MSHADETEGTRRDFIYYATAGAGAITAGAAIWPLINQMNPTADVQALASIEVSISDLEPGTQITVKWLGKPVFIRRRTQAEINEARKVEVGDLPDSDARNNNIGTADATDKNRSLDESGERVACYDGSLHSSRMRTLRGRGWGLWGMVLSMPRLALRHSWKN